MSTIIFLNGCGSSGKTSIAKSIQSLSDKPWLLLGVDAFIDMLPDKFIAFGERAKEGCFMLVPGENDSDPTLKVETGLLGEKFFSLCPQIAGLLADEGNDLIIDEVIFKGDDMLRIYAENLATHTVYFIQVLCELKTMQERESLRPDRPIGLSNDQFDRVHSEIRPYDLVVDTTHSSSASVAKMILDFMDKTPTPSGFRGMC